MPELSKQDIERLVGRATDVRLQAYAPHSHFSVGAAILVSSGQIFEGCNVENASYGLSLCAERVAASAAVSAGFRSWSAIAVASVGGVTPCGACRQFLVEFGTGVTIVLVNVVVGSRRLLQLGDLLPDAFDGSFNGSVLPGER
jgi:cytidine deaminase